MPIWRTPSLCRIWACGVPLIRRKVTGYAFFMYNYRIVFFTIYLPILLWANGNESPVYLGREFVSPHLSRIPHGFEFILPLFYSWHPLVLISLKISPSHTDHSYDSQRWTFHYPTHRFHTHFSLEDYLWKKRNRKTGLVIKKQPTMKEKKHVCQHKKMSVLRRNH